MKFGTRNLGVFEVLTLSQASDEMFDADQLRTIVNTMLERDVRQLVIDISSLEYLYSDAINALVSINRRVLERGGRMSLLASQSRIRDILLRAGLDSLFRIYRNEAELSVETMEYLRQSSMLAREPATADKQSSAYDQAVRASRAPQEGGPAARQPRRRSGSRKEHSPRRPLGRAAASAEASATDEAASVPSPVLTTRPDSQSGSAFPSDFTWDDSSQGSPQPAADHPPLEIYHGLEVPPQDTADLSGNPPPPPPETFFPPPPAPPQEK